MVVMVAITVMLPAMSGLVTYKKNPRKVKHDESPQLGATASTSSAPYTYAAPDADYDAEDLVSSKSSALHDVRAKLGRLHAPKITENDLPIKLELVGENELKRRVRGKNSGAASRGVNLDPAAYDYDVDELIEEELERDEEEKRKMYGKSEV